MMELVQDTSNNDYDDDYDEREDIELDEEDAEQFLLQQQGKQVSQFAPASMGEMLHGSNTGNDNGKRTSGKANNTQSYEMKRVHVPAHRYTPLKESWESIMRPLVDFMKLQVRFNPKNRSVELRNSELTEDAGALQKGCDFVQAFAFGFEVQDAIALLRLDDLYIDSFEIADVKNLHGDHIGRAIGRIAGQGGKTKFAIENATRTRVVLAGEFNPRKKKKKGEVD